MAKFFLGALALIVRSSPLSHRAKLAKIFEKSKMPAPPLAEGGTQAGQRPGPGGSGARALPCLSSAFGRGGAGILDFKKNLASFALWLRGGRFKDDST